MLFRSRAPKAVAKPVKAAPAKPRAKTPRVTTKTSEPAILSAAEALSAVEAVAETVETTEEPAIEVAAAAVEAEVPEVEMQEVVEQQAEAAASEATPSVAVAEGMTVMTDLMETTKKYAEEAKGRLQSAMTELNEKASAGMEKTSKVLEEMTEMAKGNVEALVESGKIAAKGMEAMGQDAAEYGRKSFESATATMKSFASVKSPTEFFQLQSELLSSTFDSFAKESAKSSEAMLKLAGDVVQPISSRISLVTEKVKSLAA